jgi:hypothetical protein
MGTKSGPYFQDSKAHEKAVSMEAVNVGPFLEARFGARFWGRILTFFWRSLSPFLMNVVMNCAHFFLGSGSNSNGLIMSGMLFRQARRHYG